MYAVFEDGSHQYRVSEGDVVRIDYREAPIGSTLELEKVLLAGQGADVKIGQPYLAGAKVVAEVLREHSDKLQIQHFRRRKHYRRLRGHTQTHVEIKIKGIFPEPVVQQTKTEEPPHQPTDVPAEAEKPNETPAS